MWIEESIYKNDMISFRELYQSKIKNIVKNKYCPYPSYINLHKMSYIQIEFEIKKLIKLYNRNKNKYYKPTVQIYSLYNNKKLSNKISLEKRLNSFYYIVGDIPNAYYNIVPIYSNIIQPTLYSTSILKTNIKICCIGLVIIISYFLYYKKVTVKKNIIFCFSLIFLLLLLWIL
jgi:hypothetical protein